MQKQKLLFEQSRLCSRGAAEMALMYISASNGLSALLTYLLTCLLTYLHIHFNSQLVADDSHPPSPFVIITQPES